MDSESAEVSNVIADIQNEENSSDSDDDYAEEGVTTNTDDGSRDPDGIDDDRQTILSKSGSQCRRSAPSQVSAGRLQQ